MKNIICVVIPNWNGAKELPSAIESVLKQSVTTWRLIIVDNGSTDMSHEVIESYVAKDARIQAIYLDKNYGYTGGVNPGFEIAIKAGYQYVAPFNNDAVAHKDWLKHLQKFLDKHQDYGIAACKLLHGDGQTFDSTGDQYSTWGLPFPRGRGEKTSNKYDTHTDIFGASGGASMYRVSTIEEIGLFDQDFFAYYEDIDLSFRAQLAGWRIGYAPKSVVYHEQGTTSGKIKNFTTYHSFKNFPMVIVKNVPRELLPVILPRFAIAYSAFILSAARRGGLLSALHGLGSFLTLFLKKLRARKGIQSSAKVDADYVRSILLHDLPPDQSKLRKIRKVWWKLTRRNNV